MEKLDTGGMAEIYRGEAESIQGFKKQVAIKRILPNLTKNKKFVAMFLDEAKLSLHLNHANIVQMFDIGKADNSYFIVMEFVDGLNLRALTDSLRRQGRRLDIAHALFLIMEVCKGLGYAHDFADPETGRPLGIVHRDVSPPNILLSMMGEVKLVDFGLAKAASQIEQTEPGVVKGKFSYLSPEAASGNEVDHRADVFACGIILFEALTGRRLFYGETDYQTVELVRQARIPPMAALNPEVSPELERTVLRALARNPDHRFQHAYEMQDSVAQYLFSRGMKVTSRDIARLVRECQTEHRKTIPPGMRVGNVIDNLIKEEVLKFTSLDNLAGEEPAGSRPLSPEEMGLGRGPLDPKDFIDPRSWTSEINLGDILSTESEAAAGSRSGGGEIASLEEMLEGASKQQRPASPPQAAPASPPKKSGVLRGLLIALVVLVVLGIATVFVLYTLNTMGRSDSQGDDDIIRPE